jgi:hypothetical protein
MSDEFLYRARGLGWKDWLNFMNSFGPAFVNVMACSKLVKTSNFTTFLAQQWPPNPISGGPCCN